jgi:hypothetical protein
MNFSSRLLCAFGIHGRRQTQLEVSIEVVGVDRQTQITGIIEQCTECLRLWKRKL